MSSHCGALAGRRRLLPLLLLLAGNLPPRVWGFSYQECAITGSLWGAGSFRGTFTPNGLFLSTNPNEQSPNEPSILAGTGSSRLSGVDPAFQREINGENFGMQLLEDIQYVATSLVKATSPLLQLDSSATAQEIIKVCDEIDELEKDKNSEGWKEDWRLSLRRRALRFRRYELLVQLMRHDSASYTATASWLSPSRIPRLELPNVQDVSSLDNNTNNNKDAGVSVKDENGIPLVADCTLVEMKYQESWLDKTLLFVFRKLVTQHTGGVTSDIPGILGLLAQGRAFMLQPNQTPEAQHQMVMNTLGGLMTPVLPPFYRIFMSGIIPDVDGIPPEWRGKQLGPWFYAPFLTSFVTPTFFGFLVGPSRPNRRKDGQLGGLVVEKCKFLQESGCKGLCLHQCKIPAQQFFAERLGLPLTVTPNFVTQECQWSFGEIPLPVAQDPYFPKGCLSGCTSRKQVFTLSEGNRADKTFVELCN